MSTTSKNAKKKHPLWQQFLIGGTSVLPAIIITHPLDVVKLRQQISGFKGHNRPYSNVFAGVFTIVRNEGLGGLFAGISPAIIRAYTFSATRLGLYEPIRNTLSQTSTTTSPFAIKVCSALLSGSIASIVGNPFELLKVRMQGGDYNQYNNVFDGMYKVYNKEGLLTLWNGTRAAIIRASLFSASQLATYDHTKVLLKYHFPVLQRHDRSIQLNCQAAVIAGLVTTTISTPADFIKSVMMNSNDQHLSQVFASVIRKDQGRTFFRGWFANYARLGPHTVITMLTLEKLRLILGWSSL